MEGANPHPRGGLFVYQLFTILILKLVSLKNTSIKKTSEEIPDPINVTKASIILTIILFTPFILYLFFKSSYGDEKINISPVKTANNIQQEKINIVELHKNDPNQIHLQEVKNLGYIFYLGEVETNGVTNINDDIKNEITKTVYDVHFPINALKNIPIIILNNLALTGDQYLIKNNDIIKIPNLKPDFLSEGGLYMTFTDGSAIIFINKSTIRRGDLASVLTHELGHAVGDTLSDQEWSTFYKLRNIPVHTELHGADWNTSPQEDFAEVYKNTFTNLKVRTYFGIFLTADGSFDLGYCSKTYSKVEERYRREIQQTKISSANTVSGQFQPLMYEEREIIEKKTNMDDEVQRCRRDGMSKPKEKGSEWMTPPYEAKVDTKTKNFILDIVNKFSKNNT